MYKKLLSTVLALALAFCTLPCSAAKGDTPEASKTAESSKADRLPFYTDLSKEYTTASGSDEIIITPEALGLDLSENSGKSSFVWEDGVNTVSYTFTVQTSGRYRMSLEYLNLSPNGNDAVRSLYIDGASPFFEAANIVFRSKWVDEGDVSVNSLGDQVRPRIVTSPDWQTYEFSDHGASSPLPFEFELSAGEHSVDLVYVNNDMAVGDFKVFPSESIPDYASVSAAYKNKKGGDDVITVQAEQAIAYRNSSTVGMTSSTDAQVRPVSNSYRIYNTVGNDTWSQAGSSVTFSFDVPDDGLYKLALRYRQKWNDGLASYRKIEIDGSVPFSELLAVKFPYSTQWETTVLGDKNGDYLFDLSKGKHTVTMTVVLGEYTQTVHKLYDLITLLSNITLDITMLTGSEPDPNYDYQFFKFIPTLEGDFKELIDGINECEKTLSSITGKSSSISSSLKSIAYQFESMCKDPFTIAKRYSQISSAQTTLGTWYSTLQELPLSIDEFCVAEPDGIIKVRKSNIFENIGCAFKGFLTTFIRNYNGVGSLLDDDVKIKETIKVWIGQGMEWAEILKEMADKSFTPETGIGVDLSVVPSGQLNAGSSNVLLLSIISGSAPDVALSVAATSPVEFAIRDAAVDLTRFSDFESLRSQYLDSAFLPLTYKGGVYAMPETMTFTALFYRTDIFEKYNFKIPQTWDELCSDTLQILTQNGMEFYLPQKFDIFLFQNKGKFYTDDGFYSALDTPVAFSSFKQYTEMFTNNGCAVTASFFNRFRSGEMPLGIGDYGIYLQLKTAAPELADKWSMMPLIGTKQEDGSINRSGGGALSTGCLMLSKKSGKKYGACWDFIKWWTGAKAQSEFARNVEVRLGMESRWCSANKEAFLSLDWSRSDKQVLEEQWKWVVETPVVLGSAYAARYLTNAYTDCVVSGQKSSRDALEKAVININKELKYKQEEYGVFADER